MVDYLADMIDGLVIAWYKSEMLVAVLICTSSVAPLVMFVFEHAQRPVLSKVQWQCSDGFIGSASRS